MRRAARFRRWWRVPLLAALVTASAASAGEHDRSARDAARLVQAYLRAHNAHQVDRALRFYDRNAIFRLSGGRPPARGLAAIRALESFDAVAGSHLVPAAIGYAVDGNDVRVSIGVVVEHSRVFAALGLDRITTLPQSAAFVVRDGLIVDVTQPTFKPACLRAVGSGMKAFIAWMKEHDDPRLASLSHDGAPTLNVDTIPAWVAGLRGWRAASGWRPRPDDAADCARPESET